MLLTLTTTHRPATDLGFLLRKHPERHQTFGLTFGSAHVLYPEAGEDRCTAALILDIDPVALVRGRAGAPRGSDAAGLLTQYVNDRPYVASSFMSVAIARVFGSALGGRSEARPRLGGAADSAAGNISASSMARTIRCPTCSSAFGIAVSTASGRSPSGSSHWAWKASNGLSIVSRCAACTSACSACWPWKASLSIRGCEPDRRVGAIAPEPHSVTSNRCDR